MQQRDLAVDFVAQDSTILIISLPITGARPLSPPSEQSQKM